ncbi:MAG: phosphatidylglycerophosphatase A [Lysobacterales bacterium]
MSDARLTSAVLRDPAGWIASGFGSGLMPVAPGTWGSAAAVVAWLALRLADPVGYGLVVVAAFGIGTWAAGVVARRLGLVDPGVIVCDEIVGQWIALAPLAWPRASWTWVIAAFVVFRVFDVIKPWPVSWAESRKGGLGIMLDDVFAGIYAAIIILLAQRAFG